MAGTFWSIIPSVAVIAAGLITKNVNFSLIVGIILGTGFMTGFRPFDMCEQTFTMMAGKLQSNFGILLFVVLLGMLGYLMNLTGATREYANWASKKLKTKKRCLLATMLLGLLIFVDDYFNYLTVGTTMRPITDRNRISREKLSYIIDSTGAPVCIIAPVSSWAAAVSASLPDGSTIDGFKLFLQTIPYNYYAWFSIAMILITILISLDFGKMYGYEVAAENGSYEYTDTEDEGNNTHNGKTIDLVLPILVIVLTSIGMMLYTGGFFSGADITSSFKNCDAILSLAIASVVAVIFQAFLYLPRKIVTPSEFMDGLVIGFQNMVPAVLIFSLAWTFGAICGSSYMDTGGFVASFVERYHIPVLIMPVSFFMVSLLLSFATGTSWGTFAIVLPIAVSVFRDQVSMDMVLTIAALLGGSVCGDHLSPISDTTILSSMGTKCKHLNHVVTQLPYGLLVAGISLVSYLVASCVHSGLAGLIFGFILLICSSVVIKLYYRKKKTAKA
ncbi:MAG: Na+/H+ antiporter NhaC family protein [Candidatus Limivicinus sp.]|jgi:tetracycline resistance efflux pump